MFLKYCKIKDAYISQPAPLDGPLPLNFKNHNSGRFSQH